MSGKLSKIARQHEKTWAQLNRRLMSIPFNYNALFPEAVATFLQNKAESLSSCPGYLVPCLLASTAFVIAGNNVIQTRSHEMTANLYIVFVGPPTTGKSPALKEGALDPMLNLKLERDLPNFIIEKCTSLALVKSIASTGQGFIISPEIYEVLNKLSKSDEENETGDAQILCRLFSGKRSSYRFTTENVREIPANVPFSILGTTQVPYAVRLICRMDQGHGPLDQFLFPNCLRPTTERSEAARTWLQSDDVRLKDITDIFLKTHDLHLEKSTYKFTEDGVDLLKKLSDDFIQEVNEAIEEGNVPPKSKRIDLIQRVAVSLHVFNHIASALLRGQKPAPPTQEVSKDTLEASISLIEYAESQKQIVAEVIQF